MLIVFQFWPFENSDNIGNLVNFSNILASSSNSKIMLILSNSKILSSFVYFESNNNFVKFIDYGNIAEPATYWHLKISSLSFDKL